MISGRLEDTEQLIHEGIQLGWSLQDSTVPDPRRRPALLAAPRARARCASSRTRCASSPTSSPAMPAGASRWPPSTSTPAARREARREYDRLAERDFATIPRDNVWSIAIALLAELGETFRDAERSRARGAARRRWRAQRRHAHGHLRRARSRATSR
jgi:hypothetical protein